uniref:G_PROTEIN_RECEP_F1_2 domain-containing protein n=1 Tax=Syphacia muris TaxID=451379 RepID=A0A0N5AJK9_9BILA
MVAIGTILVIIILACIIGNLFVILAILIERDLRCRPQYYLIFSLAVADLLVGLIVTPLYAWATVTKAWKLGAALCDIWITTDLLLCTSSILHLVAIALDRYWSVTDITYVQNRTPKRIFTMLAVVWVVSLVISVAPIFGWKDSNFLDRVEKQHVCLVSQQISFQIFSTATAFYIPLCAITFVYYKIMRAAKLRFKRERDRKTIRRLESDQLIAEGPENEHKVSSNITTENCNGNVEKVRHSSAILTRFPRLKRRSKESSEMKRQRKAWRTLAIITGTFVASWTPFFLVAVYRPICGCEVPELVERLTNWLGYLNSAINPVIYTIFSLDFRNAFHKLLKRILFINDQRRTFHDCGTIRR